MKRNKHKRTPYTKEEKAALIAELVRRWESGDPDYRGPDGRWNLAWDVGVPYVTANVWLRQALARKPTRR